MTPIEVKLKKLSERKWVIIIDANKTTYKQFRDLKKDLENKAWVASEIYYDFKDEEVVVFQVHRKGSEAIKEIEYVNVTEIANGL
ncbi:MAG: hypothetical protein HRT61_24975 [Ekhidna sp.]|nr:hypothetical protein [Ekhidna sp.]